MQRSDLKKDIDVDFTEKSTIFDSIEDVHCFQKKYLDGDEGSIKWCTACDNCIEFLIHQKHTGCAAFNEPYTASLKAIRAEEGKLRA